eukprot:TRINITY_DN10333_c0_g1_i1.p1 TRINITY_DN10333_c0_g1~~TRINITY_DN10333_c0_g1_i1.p1  ORF type:complete len:111 (-),score=39.43 TRINITY_DN10333_c0_g1_i1:71-403(-)
MEHFQDQQSQMMKNLVKERRKSNPSIDEDHVEQDYLKRLSEIKKENVCPDKDTINNMERRRNQIIKRKQIMANQKRDKTPIIPPESILDWIHSVHLATASSTSSFNLNSS